MRQYLQLEFYKYRGSKSFYIILGLYVLMATLTALNFISKQGQNMSWAFPDVWHNLIWFISLFNSLLGVLLIISITGEFQYNTMRQHIVDGFSRGQFFVAKYLYAVSLAAFACVFAFVFCAIIGSTHASPTGTHSLFEGIGMLGNYFVQVMGYLSIAFFFSLIIRTSGLSIIVYVAYILLEWLISVSILGLNSTVWEYFPKSSFSDTVAVPAAISMIMKLAKAGGNTVDHLSLLLTAIGYLIVFAGVNYWLIARRDIKS